MNNSLLTYCFAERAFFKAEIELFINGSNSVLVCVRQMSAFDEKDYSKCVKVKHKDK